MITVHHLENSRSQRILWLLEELGVGYEIKAYKRDAETSLAPPELEKLHPLGKAPIVTDDDITLAESGAIIEYLVDKFDDGTLRPDKGTPEGRAYSYWLHYAEGSFAPLMMMSLIMSRIETAPVLFFLKPVTRGIAAKVRQAYLDPTIAKNLAQVEDSLTACDWLCGDSLSAADIQMSFAMEAAEARVGTDAFPGIAGFLERMRARPAFQAAIERGGPYALLGVTSN